MAPYWKDPDYNVSTPSSKTTVNYPLDAMSQAAAKILVDADLALTNHTTHWKKVQDLVTRFPGFMQGPLLLVLNPYEQRLRASFQWQMDFASALFDTVDLMGGAEQDVAQSFQPKGFGHGHQNVE